MTREELIDRLKNFEMGWEKPNSAFSDFWRAVIDELEQEPCDDAISRDAVMKIVDEEWICNADYDFRSLVESIEKLPSVNATQHTSNASKDVEQRTNTLGDAVSREAVYSILKEYHLDEEEINSAMDECQNLTVNAIASDVSLLPSVTHKSGKWINKEFRKEEYVLTGKCSVCGQVRVKDKFCSNCGCRMVEPQERSDKE